ncbi:proline-rich protein 12-like [Leguminivora glycinivorella]|uniref:proline-rich protein 12-like n=1 Tax=Leguminivora glycinivorella TaxID=1035111 RepID=UPI00200F69CF|nr:proline-rich protein 12-like [Leguminivora glycinivorella]
MGKRKNEEEEIRKKIRRLESKLLRRARSRSRVLYSSDSSETDDDKIVDSDPRDERHASPRDHVASPPAPPPRAATPPPTPASAPPPPPPPQPRTPQPPTQPAPPRPASPQPGPSSAPDLPVAQPQVLSSAPEDAELGDDILLMLGDAPKPELVLGDAIHKDVASRWQEILLKGLQKEAKEKLLQEYLVPSNCDLLVAPTLNAEAKAALTDNLVRRDHAIMEGQRQLGIALAALAQAMDLLLKPDAAVQNVLKPVTPASKDAEQARCRALPAIARPPPVAGERPRSPPPELAAPPQLPLLQEVARHEVQSTHNLHRSLALIAAKLSGTRY